jgi:lipopolysaccharide heptosyltransferase II
MGDVLMTTPAMKALKNAVPGRKLTLLTSPEGAKIARYLPFIDEVITFEAPWLKGSSVRSDSLREEAMINELRIKRFDASVIFTVYSQNPLPGALLCYLAEIPLRAAYCRENPYALLTDWVREQEPQDFVRHEVRRHLELAGSLGADPVNLPLSLEVREEDRRSLREKVEAQFNVDDQSSWVLLHPGASAPSRRYSPEKFSRVADFLREASGRKIIFSGAREENDLISSIQKNMVQESVNLAGKLSLGEMLALVERAPLLISNNTGPVHIAAALGTPVVVLYALTNPQHTPWLIPHHVLTAPSSCGFCYKSVCPTGTQECLEKVTPEEVVTSALELLEKESSPCYDFSATEPLQRMSYAHT